MRYSTVVDKVRHMHAIGRINRYVIAELLKVFLLTLAILTLLMVLVGVAHEAILQGLGPAAVLRLIPYTLPNALVFALPGTLLFAACTVYGHMSAANEIVALKSLGVPPLAILWPALVLSLLLSLLNVWLVNVAFTWGHRGIRQVVFSSIDEVAYRVLRSQRYYANPHFSIRVAAVRGRQLLFPVIHLPARGGMGPVTIAAREAEFQGDPADNALHVVLTDGTIEVGNRVSMTFPDRVERRIPLGDATDLDGHANPSHLSMSRIPGEIERQRQAVERAKRRAAVALTWDLALGDFRSWQDPRDLPQMRSVVQQQQRLNRLRTEPWRRWASGFACFSFVLVGIPLAIRLRTADIMTSFGLCFLPILIVYYPLFALGLDRAKYGRAPPAIVWLGNLVCLV
ncbi:MAG: LptF/LptG family permease, partial [Pirellulales bacterium]